jgi:hypothetical protein
MNAGSSAPVATGSSSSLSRSSRPAKTPVASGMSRSRPLHAPSARRISSGAASSGRATASAASLFFKIARSSVSRSSGEVGMATAPIFTAPRKASIASRLVPSRSRTRSPRRTPSVRRALPAPLDRRRRSSYV